MMNAYWFAKVLKTEPCGCQIITDRNQLSGCSLRCCSFHLVDALMALPRDVGKLSQADHHYQQEMRRG